MILQSMAEIFYLFIKLYGEGGCVLFFLFYSDYHTKSNIWIFILVQFFNTEFLTTFVTTISANNHM